ncbi:MAG: SDR family NAD(P)-dependent oxidoreductase [Thermoanaerobaculia bacterium]|nr:SDR family NAD(P)-dependent oxidoreductase [Thermoanaerobaculia bacterium]
MRIFLTGATGYIGGALAKRLAAAGHELTALVRETSDTAALEALGVELFPGDVTDRYSLREGMSGADWVVHSAAVIDFGAGRERMWQVNVGGSENVASLASKLGVGRVLNVSSMAAFGGSPADGSPGTEESPPNRPLPGAYSVTKRAGADAFFGWAERGLKLNTVYPGLVYGPPGKRTGANALLRNVVKGRLPAVVGGEKVTRWVHVDDLVEGLVRVMERAEPGASYLMTGDAVRVAELVRQVARLAGVKPPRLELSPAVAGLLARLATPLLRLRGRRPPLVRDELQSLKRHWNFDDARARADLGWHPRTLAEGLPDTVAFLAT